MNDSGHSSTSDPTRKPPKKPKNLNLPPPEGCDNFLKTTPPADLDNPDEGGKPERKTQRSLSAVSEKDREMFEYIESLQKDLDSSSVEALITENTFDYIEKFYKLVERVLELKQQNFKLQKRIRDLEYLKNQQGQAEAEEQQELEEKDEALSEALLESILQDIRNKEFLKEKRTCGVAAKHAPLKSNEASTSKKGAKVSKWTKVKAAFRWEKASNVEDSTAKSQDSGIHVPLNCEVARYLRVPSTSDEMGHSPGDSGAGISTPGTISSASSNDELRLEIHPNDGFRSSDDENPQHYTKKSHHKYHRTPWAKMKNIINHPRNSFKKKHRLSAASDDIQIDVEFCSDNEDVFETDDTGNKSTNISLSPSPNVYSSVSSNSPSCCDIPPDVVERYQRALKEDFTQTDLDPKSTRWTRVRKAFLARDPHLHPVRKTSTSYGITKGKPTVEDEIQKNYKKLQKKLSLEFQEKISEWERIKQNSPGAPNSPTMFSFSEETRNPLYMKRMEEFQMQSPQDLRRHISVTREKDLPDDFKKKLQEWEKIKKRSTRSSTRNRKKLGEITKWKSLGGPRSSDHSPVFDYPVISDDFRKKLDEWKQIKAAGGPSAYAEQKKKDKTPSPKLSRKSSQKQSKKRKDHHKELHWFEKELGKIEKEKQRLERERHKYIEREERLSKLRHSMLGNPQKKEILVHTQSGFHRFEGISRKFTQKLYEWEKSQGIAPEASTFALLSTSTLPKTVEPNDKNLDSQTSSLSRSKSVDSIPNLARPVLSGQPSSLSLNDMDDLEKSLLDSKNSSLQDLDLDDTLDDTNPETDEPEAVLVEVEDYEEETTEPLHISCIEKHQLPVYQREEFKPLCESETIALPKVRRSESAKAQVNYDLMETVSKLLTELQVTEDEIRALAESKNFLDESNLKTFKFLNQLQNQSTQTLADTVQSLEEANHSLTKSLAKESKHLDIMEAIHESSVYMRQQVGQMHDTISERLQGPYSYKDPVFEQIRKVRSKISELRRHLSQVCAAGDRATINRKLSSKVLGEVTHDEVLNLPKKSPEVERHFIKSEGSTNMSVSTGAVKKRISRRQMALNQPDSDEEVPERPAVKLHRKLTRTRSISEGDAPVKLLQPSASYEDRTPSPEVLSGSAVTLFVKTTRKLFTPIVEASLGKVAPGESESSSNTDSVVLDPKPSVVASLPPLPPSPVPQRKVYRDVSPNIKMIIAKYNQNVDHSAAGSSGSNSPVAWRSPVSERRRDSAVIKPQPEDTTVKPLQAPPVPETLTPVNLPSIHMRPESLKVDITLAQTKERMRKLQQAKEEFLRTPVSAPCFATGNEDELTFPKRNRLSQISVESDSGCTMSPPLIKSASAGMINVEPDVYHRIDPEFRSEGYVSLPRQITNKPKPSKPSPFSSIANKFRKVKMRKGKDKDKKVVSTLCRQSLVVDINNAESENNNGASVAQPSNINGDVNKEDEDADNKSEVSESPSLIVKNVTWIRKSLFKR